MASLIRLAFFAVIAWYGYRYLLKLMAARNELPEAKPTQELMQRCAHCGVHVPLGESTQSRGQVFCSESHRDAYLKQPPTH